MVRRASLRRYGGDPIAAALRVEPWDVDGSTGLALVASAKGQWSSGAVNSRGFRESELTPNGEGARIAVLGDSWTVAAASLPLAARPMILTRWLGVVCVLAEVRSEEEPPAALAPAVVKKRARGIRCSRFTTPVVKKERDLPETLLDTAAIAEVAAATRAPLADVYKEFRAREAGARREIDLDSSPPAPRGQRALASAGSPLTTKP
jgi:hypothetical protein